MKLLRAGPHIGPCSLQTRAWGARCRPEEQEESRKSSETKVHVALSGLVVLVGEAAVVRLLCVLVVSCF